MDSLYKLVRSYLEEHDWYWDEEHFVYVWGHPSTEKEQREYHCWTLPQWSEYWSSDHGTRKKRRYECLKDALWSQLLREEEPKTYGGFYDDKTITRR